MNFVLDFLEHSKINVHKKLIVWSQFCLLMNFRQRTSNHFYFWMRFANVKFMESLKIVVIDIKIRINLKKKINTWQNLSPDRKYYT